MSKKKTKPIIYKQVFSNISVPLYFSVAMINTILKEQLRGEKAYTSLRKLKAESQADSMEECCLLPYT